MENNLTRKVGENYVSNDSLHSGIPLNHREKIILCETFLNVLLQYVCKNFVNLSHLDQDKKM